MNGNLLKLAEWNHWQRHKFDVVPIIDGNSGEGQNNYNQVQAGHSPGQEICKYLEDPSPIFSNMSIRIIEREGWKCMCIPL